MKLTKKIETEIWKIYDTWMHSYLNGDIEIYDSFLDNDYHFIGSAKNEEFLNRKDTTQFFADTGDQFAGKTEIRNETKTIEQFGELIFITHIFDGWFLNENDWNYYARFRFSSTLRKTEAGWRFIYQHFSIPDSKTAEGETIGYDKINEENQELREAIQRRTIELEQKNRELEIESSLERVRAIAMGMQKSEDLMSICKIVFDELQALGFTELRNTLIHVFVDEESYFTNYDYSLATGGNINKMPFKGNTTLEKFIKVIRKSDEAFSQLTIKGKELKDWKAFRKTNREYEDKRLDDVKSLHYYNYSVGSSGIGISTYSPISKEKQDLLQRFRNVFQLSYKRYKDISNAEAQAKETRIDLALERVRSQALAMKQSSDLLDIVVTMRNEFTNLGYEAHYFWHMMWLPETYEKAMTSGDGTKIGFVMKLPRHIHGDIPLLANWEKSNKPTVVYAMNVDEALDYVNKMVTLGDFQNIDPQAPTDDDIKHIGGLTFIMARTSHGEIGYSLPGIVENPPKEDINILVKFAGAFDLAHRRFLDLQKSEKQARETQIELALEKVRSRTMAMHKSTDLAAVIENLFYQLKELDLKVISSWVSLVNVEKNNIEIWVSHGETKITPVAVKGADFENFQQEIEAWKNKQEFILIKMPKEVAKKTLKDFFHIKLSLPKEDSQFHLHQLWHEHGFLGLGMWKEASNEEFKILQRFTKVFQQTYTRFLDLQKAEAQARESEIELALERVRARTMAMQHSDELQEASFLLDEQVRALGIKTWGCAFNIYGDKESTEWFGNEAGMLPTYTVPHKGIFKEYYQKGQKGESFFIKEFSGKACEDHYEYMSSLPVIGDVLKNLKKTNKGFPTYQLDHVVYFKYGYLLFITKEHVPESHDIFKRFAKVFEQTYTRFLDLQKAEAQAKEAKIETSLEKVRSRSLAMQNSDELKELIGTVYKELNNLDMDLDRCLIWIMNDDDYSTRLWMANREAEPVSFYIQNHKNPPYKAVLKGWKERNTNWEYHLKGKVKKDWDKFVFEETEMKQFPATLKTMMQATEQSVMSGSFHSFGCLQTAGHKGLSEEQRSILIRFAKVFNQAYTRFSDLQKAEAQAREAQIEVALEKVRSRTMAMQKGEELQDVVVLLYKELIKLGVTNFVSCGYVEINEKTKRQLTWVTNPGGDSLGLFFLPLTGDTHFDSRYDAWKQQQTVFHQTVAGKERRKHLEYAITTFNSKEAEEMVLNQFPDPTVFYCFNFSHGYLHLVCGSELNKEEESLLSRFTKIFEQTYARFLDLKKAEAQAREAQIEAALERVRSRSMAMHNTEELKEVIQVLYNQFVQLNINIEHAGFILDYKENEKMHIWLADEHAVFPEITIPYFDCAHWNSFNEAKKKGQNFFANQLGFEEKNKFYKDMFEFLPDLPEETKATYFKFDALAISTVLLENIGLYIENYSGTPFSDEENKILMRIGKVFQQTYTRFLDLQKAEAQARESEIELVLERVRSRSMAMHNSDELREAGALLFNEITKLGIESITSGYVILEEDEKIGWNYMADPSTGKIMPFATGVFHDKTDNMRSVIKNWKKQEPVFVIEMDEQQTIDHQTFIAEQSINFPISAEELIAVSPAQLKLHAFNFKQGYLLNIGGELLTDDQSDIMLRFTKVFQQTYTRFLDLQKAEAQAREAKIEMALEKVRSRTMAMQHSDELPEAANVLFMEVQGLGIPAWSAGYNILSNDKKSAKCIMSSEGEIQAPFTLPLTEHSSLLPWYKAIKRKDAFFEYEQGGKELVEHYKYMATLPELKQLLRQYDDAGISLPTHQINHLVKFTNGFLLFITYENVPEAHDIFKRFGKVFEQTYTRFLDLQNAEAQAREAQIEAALERVRSRSMAMHKSEEMLEVIEVVAKQLLQLNLKFETVSFGKNNQEGDFKFWLASPGQPKPVLLQVPFLNIRVLNSVKEAQKKGVNFIEDVFTAEENKEWSQHMITFSDLKHFPQIIKDFILNAPGFARSSFLLKNIDLYVGNYRAIPFTKEENAIFSRFAHVFEQSYTRFLDLQKAEAQARESLIEASLERVRSRTLAMQNSEELAQTSVVVFQQLLELGIAPNRLFIGIVNNNGTNIEAWATNEDGSKLGSHFTLQASKNKSIKKMLTGWKQQKKSLVIDMTGKELQDYFQYLNKEMDIPFIHGLEQKRRVQTIAYFSGGLIGMAAAEEQPEETIKLLERFAAVFNLTYTRFNDLKISEAQTKKAEEDLIKLQAAKKSAEDALSELQLTQTQLIQSEKMASLGELTAGIAHEIQNPLNFVNNFSEVSQELIDELKEELENGDMEEVHAILNDVIQNLEKINHHGKRADGIVKGMLQHSRSSSGTKEPTNVNALADEYLRLAYHGLRAKDKSFNATLVTDFDESIGKINIIPQDIGRVVLNLLTNAFYIVNEKKQLNLNGYQPTVNLTTKKNNNMVTISVKDNGNGIPKHVLEKIFQPFFTTKPTGQGTGLGLSMSYDIITKGHGGELKVETKQGVGTEFIIKLPI
ncbi:ATP-binding protein [Formosa maritima]|uniref:histidine kinase n=1 Tax=Formosa maritima TaxID=2592046 RepID=A0A5D0GF16_9FLAO|nr:ATP-binding protein [Formosa maritima]TYA57516.1 hypothetical protein FVF61_04620 [Formosa maritima]